MTIIIIPGFMGHPEEITFTDLGIALEKLGHHVVKIAPPHFPMNLSKYSLSATIEYCRDLIKQKYSHDDLVLIGSSMGGILATILATEFSIKKLILLVSPYQAGTDDDIAGKYSDWKSSGFRIFKSSQYGKLKIPFAFIEDARQYNALDFVERVTCPTLFIAAEKDDKVGPKPLKMLYDKAKCEKEWYVVEGAEHKYQYQPEKLALVNKLVVSFIQK